MFEDVATGWEDFMQQTSILVKVKKFPKVLRDDIMKEHSNGESYRAIAKT